MTSNLIDHDPPSASRQIFRLCVSYSSLYKWYFKCVTLIQQRTLGTMGMSSLVLQVFDTVFDKH